MNWLRGELLDNVFWPVQAFETELIPAERHPRASNPFPKGEGL
jgi:hypothetical protein